MDCKVVSLFSLAEWKNGLAFRQFQFSSSGKPIIKIAELKNGITGQTAFTQQEFDKSVHLTKGDMVFSWSGNPGTSIDVFWYDLPDGWLNQHIFKVTPAEGVNKLYLFYLLKFLKPQFTAIAANKQTTGLGHVTVKDMKELMVALPDIETQRLIGEYLYAIDRKAYINNRINDNLQLQLTAIFREWFIDAPKSAEWPRGTFADLIDHTISGDWGKDAPTGNYTEMVYCIRGADIPEVKAGNKGKMPTRYILPKNYAAKSLVDGDIVVEISGGSPTQSTGRAAPVSESLLRRYDRGMVCTNFCKAIKPKRGYSMFVYYYWQHLYDAGVFFGYENGTTGIKNLDITGFIETEEIVLPPLDIVERFDTICQTIANKVYANGLENERLAIGDDRW